jgi:hypothetical protein
MGCKSMHIAIASIVIGVAVSGAIAGFAAASDAGTQVGDSGRRQQGSAETPPGQDTECHAPVGYCPGEQYGNRQEGVGSERNAGNGTGNFVFGAPAEIIVPGDVRPRCLDDRGRCP